MLKNSDGKLVAMLNYCFLIIKGSHLFATNLHLCFHSLAHIKRQ